LQPKDSYIKTFLKLMFISNFRFYKILLNIFGITKVVEAEAGHILEKKGVRKIRTKKRRTKASAKDQIVHHPNLQEAG